MMAKILIIGKKDNDINVFQKVLKDETHFVSRIIPINDTTLDTALKFHADIIIFNVESDLQIFLKLFKSFQQNESLAETPLVLFLPEDIVENIKIDIPTQINDIYSKPVRPKEYLSRLLFLFKKNHRIVDQNIIRAEHLEIDISKYEVRVDGKKVDLTYTEYELLRFFASHPGQVFDRDVLLNKVWGYDYFGGARTVDVHVRRLRAKIESKPGELIETIRNIGYRFKEELK